MSAVDDVFESWEEMEESGALDKKLKALEVNSADGLDEESKNKDRSSDTRIIILGDETMRTQYAPKPTVKILKRPDRSLQGDGPLLNGDKPKQPIKSLKQREQEYAEARKRILGEEKSPEEKISEVNKIQGKPSLGSGSNVPTNVTRMPTGPDGTKGFNVRRERDGYEAESSELLRSPWVIIQGTALPCCVGSALVAALREVVFMKGKQKNDDAFVQ